MGLMGLRGSLIDHPMSGCKNCTGYISQGRTDRKSVIEPRMGERES